MARCISSMSPAWRYCRIVATPPPSTTSRPLAASCREVVIDADRAALTAMHLPKRTRGEGPFVERGASDAQRVVETLVEAGAVTVDGYGEAVDAELGHGLAFLSALVN